MRMMRDALCVGFVLVLAGAARAGVIQPFISEIHYDNIRADQGEFIAVTAAPGTDLSGWRLVLYNGADGAPYGSVDLHGVVSGGEDWAELAWDAPGLQNGSEAVALVSPGQAVVDFIAYEGTFDVLDGVATGLVPRRLPVAEDGNTPPGHALQRTGRLDDWAWLAGLNTRGVLNEGLVLPRAAQPVPAPPTGLLWLSVPVIWALVRRRPAIRQAAGTAWS